MATRTSQLIVELLDRVSGPARRVSDALGRVRKSASDPASRNFTDALNGALERTNAMLADARAGVIDAVGGFYALRGAIAAPVASAMALESAMSDVKKVVDFKDDAELAAFTQQLLDLTKVIPMSVEGLAAIAAAAGQAGIAKDDLIAFTDAAARVGVAFDISAEDAGQAMAKMMTGLGLSLPEVIRLSDAMNHLSNQQASSAAEVMDVVRRVGAMAKQYGFTAEEVAAFGSAMVASGAQTEVAATSFMNMGRALTRGASATKRQRDAYAKLGMDAEKVAKSMQTDAVKTTITVMEAIAALPAEMRASVSSDLFGDEARALGPLLTNLDLVRESMGLVADETNYAGSAFKEYEARAKTFENRLQLFRNALSRVGIVIGTALLPPLTELMDRIEPVLDRIGEWISANPQLVAGVMAAVGALVAFRGAVAALTFASLLGKSGALTALAFGMNTVGRAARGAWGAASASVALQTALARMDGQKIGLFTKLGAALRGLAAVTGLTAIKAALAGLIGVVATISAPVWLAIAAAVAAVGLAWKYWGRVSAFISGVGRAIGDILAPALDAIRPVLDWFAPIGEVIAAGWDKAATAVSAVGKWLGSIFSQETLSEEDKAKAEQAGYDFVMAIWDGMKRVASEVTAWMDSWIGRLIFPVTGAINLMKSIKGGEGDGVTSDPMGTGFEQRAGGGPIRAGTPYIVGEDGPELITPSRSGFVHPAGETQKMMSGTGGGTARAAVAAPPGKVTLNLGGVTINAAPGQSAQEVAERAIALIEQKIGAALRGIQADTGMEAY